MTKKELMLETLNNLKYQIELSKKYERILGRKNIAANQDDERLVRQALMSYIYDLEDDIEEELSELVKYLNERKGGNI